MINAGLDPAKIEDAKRIVFNEMQRIADGEIDEALFKKSQNRLSVTLRLA